MGNLICRFKRFSIKNIYLIIVADFFLVIQFSLLIVNKSRYIKVFSNFLSAI